jgi:hypothetical protein
MSEIRRTRLDLYGNNPTRGEPIGTHILEIAIDPHVTSPCLAPNLLSTRRITLNRGDTTALLRIRRTYLRKFHNLLFVAGNLETHLKQRNDVHAFCVRSQRKPGRPQNWGPRCLGLTRALGRLGHIRGTRPELEKHHDLFGYDLPFHLTGSRGPEACTIPSLDGMIEKILSHRTMLSRSGYQFTQELD